MDDYYNNYGDGDSPFAGYIPTTVNPGYMFLIGTISFVAFCTFLGVFLRCKKKRKEKKKMRQLEKDNEVNYITQIQRRYSNVEEDGMKRSESGLELLDLERSEIDMISIGKTSDIVHVEKIILREEVSSKKVKTNVFSKKLRTRRTGFLRNFSTFSKPRLCVDTSTGPSTHKDNELNNDKNAVFLFELQEKMKGKEDHYRQMDYTDQATRKVTKEELNYEIKSMFDLARP